MGFAMTDNSYPTGFTLGVTETSEQTLYRYVRLYRDFFSEGARKRTKGRRFTDADVELILTLKSLYHERQGEQQIRELLTSGYRIADNANSKSNREAFARMFEIAEFYDDKAHEIERKADQVLADYKKLRDRFERLEQRQAALDNAFSEDRRMYAAVVKDRISWRRWINRLLLKLFGKDENDFIDA